MVFVSKFGTCLAGGFVDAAYPSLLEEAVRAEAGENERVDSFVVAGDLQRNFSSVYTRRGLEKSLAKFRKEKGLDVRTAAAILRKRAHPLIAETFENVILNAGPDLPRTNRKILAMAYIQEGGKVKSLQYVLQQWENFWEQFAKKPHWETKPRPSRNRVFGDVLDAIAHAKLANWDLLKLITYLEKKIPPESAAYWAVFVFYQVIDIGVLKGERISAMPRPNFGEIQQQSLETLEWNNFKLWAEKWEKLAKDLMKKEAIRPEQQETTQNRKKTKRGFSREEIFEAAAPMRSGKALAVYNAFMGAKMVFEAEVAANIFWGVHKRPRIPVAQLPHANGMTARGAIFVENRLEALGLQSGLHPKSKSERQKHLSEGKKASFRMDKLFAQAQKEGVGMEEFHARFVADSELSAMLGDRRDIINAIFVRAMAPNGHQNRWDGFEHRFSDRMNVVTRNNYRRKFAAWKQAMESGVKA